MGKTSKQSGALESLGRAKQPNGLWPCSLQAGARQTNNLWPESLWAGAGSCNGELALRGGQSSMQTAASERGKADKQYVALQPPARAGSCSGGISPRRAKYESVYGPREGQNKQTRYGPYFPLGWDVEQAAASSAGSGLASPAVSAVSDLPGA